MQLLPIYPTPTFIIPTENQYGIHLRISIIANDYGGSFRPEDHPAYILFSIVSHIWLNSFISYNKEYIMLQG